MVRKQYPEPWVPKDQQRLEFAEKPQPETGEPQGIVSAAANDDPLITLEISDAEEREQMNWNIYHLTPPQVFFSDCYKCICNIYMCTTIHQQTDVHT